MSSCVVAVGTVVASAGLDRSDHVPSGSCPVASLREPLELAVVVRPVRAYRACRLAEVLLSVAGRVGLCKLFLRVQVAVGKHRCCAAPTQINCQRARTTSIGIGVQPSTARIEHYISGSILKTVRVFSEKPTLRSSVVSVFLVAISDKTTNPNLQKQVTRQVQKFEASPRVDRTLRHWCFLIQPRMSARCCFRARKEKHRNNAIVSLQEPAACCASHIPSNNCISFSVQIGEGPCEQWPPKSPGKMGTRPTLLTAHCRACSANHSETSTCLSDVRALERAARPSERRQVGLTRERNGNWPCSWVCRNRDHVEAGGITQKAKQQPA